jgi:CHAD domain-containing protein
MSIIGWRLVARYLIGRYNVSVTDLGYRLLAARYIRRQAKLLGDQFDGVRAAADIEFVHRARVATRRLRAALRMFDNCFGRKRFRRWRKAIRRTTARLGSARDRDVQIEFLCGTLSALGTKECFPGISHVLVQLEHDRERLQRKVVKAVDRLEAKGTLREIRRVAERILRKAAGEVGKLGDLPPGQSPAPVASEPQDVQTPAVSAQIERCVLRQLDELLQHQDSLAYPDDRQRHHAMRIATKRLRYTLEIARPVCPGQLDEAYEAIKNVQTLLGDIHDCDVWAAHLDVFAAAERDRITAAFGHAGRFAHLQAGIDYLREDRRRHRQELFRKLVEYWAELGRRRFWQGLAGVVLAPGESLAVSIAEQAAAAGTKDESACVSPAPCKPPLTAGP